MKENEKLAMIGLQWAISFQELAIADLAAALARLGRPAAGELIRAIETRMADALTARKQELVERGKSVAPLMEIGRHLRKTIDAAKDAIDQAAQPH